MSEGATSAPLRVLYDDSCGLCRRLAEYGRTRSEGRLAFESWQAYSDTEEAARYFDADERAGAPSRLRVLVDDGVLEDQAAWSAILTAYPPFEKFAWMVERLGMLGPVSTATYHGAQWLRQRCGSCP